MTPDVFVTFLLANQLCGLPVQSVRDVLNAPIITPIPLSPAEIAGSLNLRGRIVTAIDVRRRLRLPPASPAAPPMSVVVELGNELYALLVDQVGDVACPAADTFERNPPTLTENWLEFSNGIYRMEDRLMVILDIARLLALQPA